ncbi:hypothetical protein OIO90_005147 [Microbotryomycetes sp. JL221]|nr:hypothetical protein OIO90_005147 [Microbotryomycetes sp. JL221]
MAFQQPQRRQRAPVHAQQSVCALYSDVEDDRDRLSSSVDSAVVVFGGNGDSSTSRRPPRFNHSITTSTVVVDDDRSWHQVHSARDYDQRCVVINSNEFPNVDSVQSNIRSPTAPASVLLPPQHAGDGIFQLSTDEDEHSDLLLHTSSSSDEASLVPSSAASDASDALSRRATSSSIAFGPTCTSSDLDELSSLASLTYSDDRLARHSHNDDTFSSSSSSAAAADAQHEHDTSFTISGSWALTEAALSTIPDASASTSQMLMSSSNNVNNSTLLSSSYSSSSESSLSSEDESLIGIVGSRRARRRLSKRKLGQHHHKIVDNDKDNEATSSSSPQHRLARDAYPSPPPESNHLRLSSSLLLKKRRHKQNGRAKSSQKRSSASGSIAGKEAARSASNKRADASSSAAATTTTSTPVREEEEEAQSQVARRHDLENQLLLGSVLSKFVSVDTGTLEMLTMPLTPGATPTPSRSASPNRHLLLSTPKPRERDSHQVTHGLQRLAAHARQELGQDGFGVVEDAPMFFFESLIEDEQQDEQDQDDGGDETETEMPRIATSNRWVHSTSPPVFAPRTIKPQRHQVSVPTRSFSTSSVPAFLAALQQQDEQDDDLSRQNQLVRSNSFVSTCSTTDSSQKHQYLSRRRGLDHHRHTHHHELIDGVEDETMSMSSSSTTTTSPWGGEFERFEAALSYWRRLLNKLRSNFIEQEDEQTNETNSNSILNSPISSLKSSRGFERDLMSSSCSGSNLLKSNVQRQQQLQHDRSTDVDMITNLDSEAREEEDDELEWSIEVPVTKYQIRT